MRSLNRAGLLTALACGVVVGAVLISRSGDRSGTDALGVASPEPSSAHGTFAELGAGVAAELAPAVSAAGELPAHEPSRAPAASDRPLGSAAGLEARASGLRISGTVLDEAGAPIAAAAVAIARLPRDSRQWGFHSARRASTDLEGKFSLDGVEPGRLVVVAAKVGYQPVDLVLAESDADGGMQGLVLTLNPGLSISGRIEDSGGARVEGALVAAFQRDDLGWGDEPRSPARQLEVPAVFSRSDGSFEILGLREGEWLLQVERPSTEGVRRSAERRYFDYHARLAWVARRDYVPAGSRDLVLVLPPEISVRGRVVDPSGQAHTRFRVTSERVASNDPADRGGGPSVECRSSADGSYELTGLAPGRWELTATVGAVRSSPVHVEATVPMRRDAPDLVVARLASVTGVVLDPDGRPAPQAWVHRVGIANFRRNQLRSDKKEISTPCDERGRFEFQFAAGAARLVASRPGLAASEPVAIEARPDGQTEVEIRLRRPATIRCLVVDADGRPDAGRAVRAEACDPDGSTTEGTPQDVVADAQGRFTLVDLVPGQWRLTTKAREAERSSGQSAPAATHLPRTLALTVAEGSAHDVVLGSAPVGASLVNVTVTRGGHSVPGCSVSTWTDIRREGAGEVSHAKTDERGRARLELLGDGERNISIGTPTGCSLRRDVVLVAGRAIDLLVELPSGTIAGRVVGPTGKPVQGVRVSIVPDVLSGLQAAYQTSKADGTFVLSEMPAGTYSAWTNTDRQFADAKLHDIVLAEGETRDGLVLQLTRGGHITGIVLDHDGQPAVGAQVYVMSREGVLGRCALTGCSKSGAFDRGPLPAGEWAVIAESNGKGTTTTAPLFVTVVEGETARVDLQLRLCATLVVHLEDDGKPCGGVVRIQPRSGALVGPWVHDGTFRNEPPRPLRLSPVPPGRYVVEAYFDRDPTRAVEKVVEVTGPGEQVVRISAGP